MADSQEMLRSNCESVQATIREFAAQIESGDYSSRELVAELDMFGGEVWLEQAILKLDGMGELADYRLESGELDDYQVESDIESTLGLSIEDGNVFEVTEHDDPMVNETSIHEYPLDVVDERGREFAVVICAGGPHIEVVADGPNSARLEGYWAGGRVTLHGNEFDTFLDYFIER